MTYRIAFKEGWKWIIILLVLTMSVWVFAPWKWYWICLKILSAILLLFVAAFFRNPDRKIPEDSKIIVAPADGRIIKIFKVSEAPLIRKPAICVSTFMNVFNVHVNRIPTSGIVENIEYRRGSFLVASKAEASSKNEQNIILIHTDNGKRVVMAQIAGVVARRIICKINAGDRVGRGWPFGMIVLGSRVDVYLPPDEIELAVRIGDKVKAGSSKLGYWK